MFVKLKARKQLKEPMTPLMVQDTPQQSQKKKSSDQGSATRVVY